MSGCAPFVGGRGEYVNASRVREVGTHRLDFSSSWGCACPCSSEGPTFFVRKVFGGQASVVASGISAKRNGGGVVGHGKCAQW